MKLAVIPWAGSYAGSIEMSWSESVAFYNVQWTVTVTDIIS